MSVGAVAAAAAGVSAAAALTDLGAVLGGRRTRRTPPATQLGALMARLGHRVGAPGESGGLAARTAAAGLPARWTAADVMAAKVGAALLAALLALVPAGSAPLRSALLLPATLATAGFFAPDLWLSRRARRRCTQARLELADVLELLQVAVAAGLPTGRAIAEVGSRHAGLVGGELAAVAARVQLGLPRAEALHRLIARLPLPEVVALAAAIERADRHGAPLAPSLTALALEARATRAVALRERAAAAGPRIQLVVATVLVPGVLLLVAAVLAHRLL
jgi:tight adherence protein C